MSDIDPNIDKTELVADVAALDNFNRNVVEEFRANGGKVGGPFEGGTLLLLHTTGAKSGQPRLSPLAYLDIDGAMLIVNADEENDVREKLKNDPWMKHGVLKLESVKRWQIFIDVRK